MTPIEYHGTWEKEHKIDSEGRPYFLVALSPNYEDIKSLNEGRPLFIKYISSEPILMSVFTIDEEGHHNDPGM